jgi:hypothetical protein
MKRLKVKIRGMYATGLTRLLLDSNCSIVYPSGEISLRLGIKGSESSTVDVSVTDRPDQQGVVLEGNPEQTAVAVRALSNVLPDVVSRRVTPPENKDKAIYDIEFPFLSKISLDRLRGRVLPTVEGHHRFRIIASEYVGLVEREVEKYPHKKREMEEAMRKRLILDALEPGKDLEIEHVKPEGKVILLRGGRIASLSEDKREMLIRRSLRRGKYDGLGLIIEKGDYALTRVTEGDWVVKHSYFSAVGVLRGEYWNINTPVEFYPDRIRYIDLHVDVVAKGGGSPELIDKDQLDHLVEARYITAEVAHRALQTAEAIVSPRPSA